MATISVPPAAVANDHRRYPGVRSFEEPDLVRFFGRRRAAEELLLRVLSVRLLLQFAPSGVGKTSLLNAGLFPRLREHHLFPVMVRLNQPAESLTDAVRRSLRESAQARGLVDPVIPANAEGLWDLLAGVQLWSQDLLLLAPVLVFDQFEEVFTLRDHAFRREFGREIGALSLGRAPDRPVDPQRGAAPVPDVKIILSLREEYLGKLEEFTASVPDLFHERLRLSPLTPAEAREAIVEPAQLPGDHWLSPAFDFEPACLDELIDYIDGSSESARVIEPLTLQLVCQRAEVLASERARAGAAHPILTIDDFGRLPGLERLVEGFYRGELHRLPGAGTARRAQQMIEQGLLDPTGKRLMLEEDQIRRRYELERPVLDALVESRLLRREPRNESVFYEISHDRLTEVIAKRRTPPRPRWVLPAIAACLVAIALIGGAAFWSIRVSSRARTSVENALGLLLDEDLVGRLREVGLSDALSHVLEKAGIDRTSTSKASVLSLRHEGEIAVERETIGQARGRFVDGLRTVEELLARGGLTEAARGELLAERARTLGRLGSLAEDAGRVSEAAGFHQQAVQQWDQLLQNPGLANLRMDDAEALMHLGGVQARMGHDTDAHLTRTRALLLALEVLSASIEYIPVTHSDYVFDQGRAMQAYADAAASLAAEKDESEAAYQLARESLRLRPLSSSARGQVAYAAAAYGSHLLSGSAQRTPNREVQAHADRLLHEAMNLFDELTRWDPDNLRLRRDSAVARLLNPEGTAQCAENPGCVTSLDPSLIENAHVAAVVSLGHFRQLAALDRDNHSLTHDIGWALSVRGRLLYALGRREEALHCLDEALDNYHRAIADEQDLEQRVDVATLFRQKGVLLEPDDPGQALAALDLAIHELDAMPAGSAAAIHERDETFAAKSRILKRLGRAAEQQRLDRDRQALAAHPDLWADKQALARGLGDEGAALKLAAAGKSGPEAVALFEQALQKFKAASAAYPFAFGYWDSQLQMYKDILRQQPVAPATAAAGPAAAPDPALERNLRGALMAAWMARVLNADLDSSDSASIARTAESWKAAYEARRDLIQYLRRHDKGAEASAQITQALPEVEEYARLLNPDSTDALSLLADVNARLGQIRWETHEDGWEEGLRSAIEYRERIASVQPANADNLTRIGRMRRVLADHLTASNRKPAAAIEYSAGLGRCRAAERAAIAPADRTSVQLCLDELAKAGYK